MLDWDDVRHFLAVRRTGTLAGAGAALRLDPTTVGRRLAALEDALGAKLFERTTSGYVATDAGERLVPRAEALEREALAFERAVLGDDDRLAGTVKLTATEMIATRFLAPHLGKLRRRYPEICVDLICSAESFDLSRREADVALRLARPREEHLVVRKLANVELGLYASRDYLERSGPVASDGPLDGHELVFFADTRAFGRENAWLEARRGTGSIALRSNSVSTLYSAVVGGAGIGLVPRLVADREEALVRVDRSSGPAPREIWQMVHKDLAKNARIRAVLGFLAEILTPPKRGAPRGGKGPKLARP